ncbi:nicotinate-nucleotide adenylyltransferase [Desulfovibrio sulfodismutans]|uniref:Nicotinate-nucleotide adenylyltransferase n=1 Tax=Desulfolutivibrio sulfodismutans TaxID=63561 RepID=A0A7K3NP38_9BACT|nr:nicotinate-nucleotide adenylyltransferase [Desulfolutivibrio sulfodismutans]NDY57887.1 nicotinate-nucleotide adenylyltransferase [Desulfolutivibrio sulfodismutans]QLA11804.1 nicotinate-nucleotide adenylyltransferase [Desulfolutivibrio sulfodismutans DSM 3696]
MHEIGVIHGRFQVLHNDHLAYLMDGAKRCRYLVVGITNPDPFLTAPDPSDPSRAAPENNPLTYYQRQRLVRAVLLEAFEENGCDPESFTIVPLPINRPELYRYYVPMDAVFFLSIYDDWGRRKRELFTSLGLCVEVMRDVSPWQKGLSATEVRGRMLRGEPWEHLTPPAAARLMKEWDVPGMLRRGGAASCCIP